MLFSWEAHSHLEPHSGCLATGAALGGNDAVGLQLLAAKGTVAFGIKFGVGHGECANAPEQLQLNFVSAVLLINVSRMSTVPSLL